MRRVDSQNRAVDLRGCRVGFGESDAGMGSAFHVICFKSREGVRVLMVGKGYGNTRGLWGSLLVIMRKHGARPYLGLYGFRYDEIRNAGMQDTRSRALNRCQKGQLFICGLQLSSEK